MFQPLHSHKCLHWSLYFSAELEFSTDEETDIRGIIGGFVLKTKRKPKKKHQGHKMGEGMPLGVLSR